MKKILLATALAIGLATSSQAAEIECSIITEESKYVEGAWDFQLSKSMRDFSKLIANSDWGGFQVAPEEEKSLVLRAYLIGKKHPEHMITFNDELMKAATNYIIEDKDNDPMMLAFLPMVTAAVSSNFEKRIRECQQ